MNYRRASFALTGAGLVLGLATAPARSVLESSMAGQMLIQMPVLALAGVLCASAIPVRWKQCIEAWNSNGLPGLLLVSFVASYWMLPRALDAALGNWLVETAKFLSLPLLLGVPLTLSWPRLHPIAKGFFVANLISMLAVVGWLYTEAPVRLCNYYLVDQQVFAGRALIAIAIASATAWGACSFAGFGRRSDTRAGSML